MNPSLGVIRTPDQRLRVFVSSTLKELAPERGAARVAVERLHLAPVMFELGARPHPPRDLYRAYLEQSDVFVGLYWEAYGWVAPTETVSGLEDEYNLATLLPKLIYIKEPNAAREPRLLELLDRIRNDDGASAKYFSSRRSSANCSRTISRPSSPSDSTSAGVRFRHQSDRESPASTPARFRPLSPR